LKHEALSGNRVVERLVDLAQELACRLEQLQPSARTREELEQPSLEWEEA
jgi:hypothetical protein